MCEKITETVPAAGVGGEYYAFLARQVFHLVALAFEVVLHAGSEGFGRLGRGSLVLVLECVQRLFADVLAKAFHLACKVRCITVNTDGGGDDQKGQDDQKPGCVIDIVQPQGGGGRGPGRPGRGEGGGGGRGRRQ